MSQQEAWRALWYAEIERPQAMEYESTTRDHKIVTALSDGLTFGEIQEQHGCSAEAVIIACVRLSQTQFLTPSSPERETTGDREPSHTHHPDSCSSAPPKTAGG